MKLLRTTADRIEQDDLIFKLGSKEIYKVLGCTKLTSGALSFWLQSRSNNGSTCTSTFDANEKLHLLLEDPLEFTEIPASDLDKVIGGPEGVFSVDGETFHLVHNVFHENGTTYVLCSVDQQYFKLPSSQNVTVIL